MFKCSYAGIGTRDITVGEALTISKISSLLSTLNILLYSGNAPGSDQCFQKSSNKNNIVFLPWEGFEKESFDYTKESLQYFVMGNSQAGLNSISSFHPAPNSLSRGARMLMARNYHQIHGHATYPRVSFVICCADPDGAQVKGGTGQAVRIANKLSIPVFNIRQEGWNQKLKQYLKENA